MKTFLKKLTVFTEKTFETIVSLLSVLLFSSFKRSRKYFKNKRRICKEDDSCFILCNGASLNSFFDKEISDMKNVMTVNFFGLTTQFRHVKPNMYIVLDNILIGGAKRVSAIEKVEKLYKELQQVDWPMTIFFPSNGNKSILKQLICNDNITIIIYNMTPVSGFKCISHWLYKKSLGMPHPQNISNAAVFCALNAGFKKIYLYGVEHSWMKSFDVDPVSHRVYINDGHFYEKENIRWMEKGDYCRWLKYIHRAMLSHFELREYADSIDAKIINKTPTSFIEAYEYEEY